MDRKVAEQDDDLRKFKLMVDNSVEEFYLVEPDGTLAYVNEAAAASLGYRVEELMALGVPGIDPVFGTDFRAHFLQLKQGPLPPFETIHITRDGKKRYKELRSTYLRIGDKEYVCGSGHDITSRKKMEETMRLAEQKHREFAEMLPQTVFEADEKGRFSFVNRFAFQTFGYEEADLEEGLHVLQMVAPWERERAAANFLKRMEGETGTGTEYTAIRKDGSTFPAIIYTLPVIHGGKLTGLRGMVVDITDVKETEAALRTSEERYRDLVQNANSIILRMDTEGNVTFFNEFAQRFFGYRGEEVLGKNVVGTIVPETETSGRDLTDLLRNIASNPDQYGNNENENVCRDGRRVWIAWTNKAIRDSEGTITGVLCVGNDITDRKRFEERLLESELRYRTFIDSTSDMVYLKDDQYLHLFANRNLVAFLGKPEEEVLGRSDFDLMPEEVARRCRQTDEEALATGRLLVNEEIFGDQIYETTKFPVPLADKRVGVGGYIREITEHKNLEAQLVQAQKMEAIGQLAGGVAHDFNNILTTIIGYGSLLTMRLDENDPLAVYVRQILTSAQKAAHLTQSLLTFSRKQILNPQAIGLNEALSGIKKLLSRIIGEDIELKTAFREEEITVMADVNHLEQVLMNLATNARDAMPNGGRLFIGTSVVEMDGTYARQRGYGKPGTYACITVEDTGAGMDEETLKRIFDPFFTTKEPGKGTGLGLSIVYGIVEQHGGHVNVLSHPGKGTAFRVYLPLTSAPLAAEEPVVEPKPEGGTELILLAEDEQAVRELTTEILRGAGYRVVEARDGDEAVARFLERVHEIDLVILDAIMPRKNGREVLDELRKRRADVKALFVSGYSESIIHKRGILEEGLHFLRKPVIPFELLRAVRKVLDGN